MGTARASAPSGATVWPWRAHLRRLGRSNTAGLIFLTAISWWIYQAVGQGFLSSFNLFSLSQLAAQTAMIGFAQLVVVVIGRLNLAIPAIGVTVVMFTGWLVGVVGINPILGILAGLLLGAAIGAFAGWLELKTGLQSFIVTLALQSVCIGAVLILSGGASVSTLPAGVTRLGGAMLFVPELSVLVIPALVASALLWYLYLRSSLGWKMLAVGANQQAAELSGVAVPRVVIISFALSGLLAGVAGVMEMIRVAAALPSLGTGWLLSSFVVPILGGTALAGGSVAVGGALVAAVFVASVNSGLVSLNVEAYWQQFAQAAALLIAVLLDQARRRGARRLEAQKSIDKRAKDLEDLARA